MRKPDTKPEMKATKPRTCVRCGQTIDTQKDSWEIKTAAGEKYATGIQHVTCPVSPALQDLPTLASPHQPVTAQPQPIPSGTPVFLTMDQAARMLHISKTTVRRRIRSGALPARRLRGGQTVLIAHADILALLEDIAPGAEC